MRFRLNEFTKGDAIRMIREWSEMTQAQFAKSIGKDISTIQRYEAGQINYNIETLMEIAEKHGITITLEKEDEH